MSKIKVIGTRTDTASMGGVACGPVGFDVACTEMHIQKDGADRYLTMCWCSEGFGALETTETSEPIFELLVEEDPSDEGLEKLNSLRDAGEWLNECDSNSPYHDLFVKMAGSLLDAMKEVDMFNLNQFDEEDEVWPWLTELLGISFADIEKMQDAEKDDTDDEDSEADNDPFVKLQEDYDTFERATIDLQEDINRYFGADSECAHHMDLLDGERANVFQYILEEINKILREHNNN